MKKICWLILLMGCLFKLNAQSNEGRLFWCGFMEHLDVGQNRMVVMVTAKNNTSGTVSLPALGWSENFSVGANSVALIPLPASAETLGSEKITSTGVMVQSRDPISVYIHQYFGFRSEATLVLPVESLGEDYYVMTYTGVVNQGREFPAEFLIIATEDETEIEITPADPTSGGRLAKQSFTITLNAGQSYQVQADRASQDLTGSLIRADKKIAVMAGNKWTQVPSSCGTRDNLLEQMYPIQTYGKQFAAIPNANMAFDVYRILAAEDDTQVRVDDGIVSQEYTLDAGAFVEFNKSIPAFIEATRPIQVAQFLIGQHCNGHSVGDPSMMLLNSIEQTRDTVTLFNSSLEDISENYINIITRTADGPFVIFDGRTLLEQGVDFTPLAGNSEYAFATIQVNAGAHTIISDGCGIIASAYGYGEAESYAYSGGASFSPINRVPIPDGGCLNDTVFFDTKLSPQRFSFQWDLGEGTRSTDARVSHIFNELGSYTVQLIVTDQCLETIDTIEKDILISLRQAVNAIPFLQVCEDNSFELSASDLSGADYQWQGPDGFYLEAQTYETKNAKLYQTGTYEVIGIISGCATFPAFTEVEVSPSPLPDLGPDTLICDETEGFSMSLYPGAFQSYRWQDGSEDPEYLVQDNGLYQITVTDEFGCIAMDSVLLEQQCPTKVYVPTVFSPNGDQVNDLFQILGTDLIAVRLHIYDRWGGLVFSSSDYLHGWDGKVAGQDAPAGAYLWKAEIEGYRRDASTFTEIRSGTVTLVR